MLSPQRSDYGGFTLAMKSAAVHDLVLVNVADQPVRPANRLWRHRHRAISRRSASRKLAPRIRRRREASGSETGRVLSGTNATAQQDVRSQRLAILEYARKHDFRIDDFIEATAWS